MKNKLLALLLAGCAAVSVFAVAACTPEKENNDDKQQTTPETPVKSGDVKVVDKGIVFTASADFMTITNDTYVSDYMNALKDNGDITFSGTVGDYGLFITTVNGYEADSSKNEYWAVYTTLTELDGVPYSNASYGTYTYESTVMNSASYGVDGLPCIAGETYAIVLASY